MSEQAVELYPAHGWDCPECGAQNFCRGIALEPSEQEREELTAMGEGADGYWMTIPDEVECCDCGRKFPTIHWKDEG